MAKPISRAYSHYAKESLALLAMMVRVARIEHKMPVKKLAARADVSREKLTKLERQMFWERQFMTPYIFE